MSNKYDNDKLLNHHLKIMFISTVTAVVGFLGVYGYTQFTNNLKLQKRVELTKPYLEEIEMLEQKEKIACALQDEEYEKYKRNMNKEFYSGGSVPPPEDTGCGKQIKRIKELRATIDEIRKSVK